MHSTSSSFAKLAFSSVHGVGAGVIQLDLPQNRLLKLGKSYLLDSGYFGSLARKNARGGEHALHSSVHAAALLTVAGVAVALSTKWAAADLHTAFGTVDEA